jgi:exopolysaccharide production protein ExoQ
MRSFLFLLLTSRIVGYFTVTANIGAAQQFKIAVRVATLGACVAVVAWHHLGTRYPRSRITLRNGVLLVGYALFLFLAAFSLIYSSSPAFSALQLLMYLESVCFAGVLYAAVLVTRREADLPAALFWAVSALTAVFLVGAYLSPELFFRMTHGGAVSRLGGLIINPNELGLLIVIGIGLGLLRMSVRQSRKSAPELLMLPILLLGLLLTSSRSSLFALALLLLFLVGSRVSLRARLLIGATSVSVAVVGKGLLYDIIFKQNDASEVFSMTGRVPFWIDLLSIAAPQRPFIGYGFQRIWFDDMFASPNAYTAGMAHNTFLQVLLGLGVLGLFVAVLQLGFTVWAAYWDRHNPVGRMALVLLIPLIVNSITEFGIFGPMNYGVTFYQIVVFALVMHPRIGAPARTASSGLRVQGSYGWT